MKDVESIMTLAPVIPVLIIDDVAHARPIAEALVAGGLRALEVTLRTPAGARGHSRDGEGGGRSGRRRHRVERTRS